MLDELSGGEGGQLGWSPGWFDSTPERMSEKANRKPPTTSHLCGTRSGYRWHLGQGENGCTACLRANCERTKAWYAKKKAEREGTPRHAPRHRETCGTHAGARSHEYYHERKCEDCAQASRAFVAQSKARVERFRQRKARSNSEMDAAFEQMRPEGKRCMRCRQYLPREAFARDRSQMDGRHRFCTANGCKKAAHDAKSWRVLAGVWFELGVNPNECSYCLAPSPSDIDHFVPRALGGTDEPRNLFPACAACNRGPGGKHDLEPFEWLEKKYPERVAFFRSVFPK